MLPCKPFKNNEKCLLFYLISFFRSQDIYIFVLTFWSCRKNDLIRNIKLIPKYNSIAFNLAYNKNKLYKALGFWSRHMLNFDFLKKDLWIVSPPHFVYDFSRKKFFMLYFINWPSLIVWLALLLTILGKCTLQLLVNQAVTSYILKLTF